MCVENGIVTVTAPDGRQKSTQLVQKSTKLVRRSTQPGLSPAQSLARRMLYELEKERLETRKPREASETP
jgi:hypothetical protein